MFKRGVDLGLVGLAVIAALGIAHAETAAPAFDLIGPSIEVKVIRGNKGLPISEVPNLEPGDRLWLHPQLPEDQSVRYLLVVAFLRGPTNPPPDGWFTRVETWTSRVREEGVHVTVPPGAEQVVLFLAPETGGDFATLRSTVEGKPGAFVRASQDLYRLGLDRSRLDEYLHAVEEVSSHEPEALHDRSLLLARSLNIKLDQQCFDKPTEQQVPCLTQNTGQLVLDDPHSQSMVALLTTGPSADLIGALGSSPMARGGYYSPYIGAVVDLARIMGNIHTAQYQYLPALSLPRQYELNLRLNNPPSFRNPKSVLVVALPGVGAARRDEPPLRPVEAGQVSCLEKSPLVLPVEGAPLVFSTQLAHDFVLHLENKSGRGIDLRAQADAGRGGFVVDTRNLDPRDFEGEVAGTLRGTWGFDKFAGPAFHFRSARATKWNLAPNDASALIVGRGDTIHLEAEESCCVEQVLFKDSHSKAVEAKWRQVKPGELEVEVSLEHSAAGSATMLVKQFGLAEPDHVPLRTYAEAAGLASFVINAGDREGILRGTRLDEVASLELQGLQFAPAGLTRVEQKDELRLASNAVTDDLHPDDRLDARVSLHDGRVLDVEATVHAPRPRMSLIRKTVSPSPSASSVVHLSSQEDLPQDSRLWFVLKTEIPSEFPHTEKIEISTADNSFDVLLSSGDGSLVLQDFQTIMATLDPLKSFGPAAFGPLRFRPVDAGGEKGDWQPLVNLVRLPKLEELRCEVGPGAPCKLSGSDLFLIESVSADPQFANPVTVPIGNVDSRLSVPRPNENAPLYFKLRDDPSAINSVLLPLLPEQY